MVDGFYSMRFAGSTSGVGSGILALYDGILVGADSGGVFYDGQYAVESGFLRVDVTLTVPPGVSLVLGTPPQSAQYQFSISVAIPLGDIEMLMPIDTPLGQVAARLRKVRDFPPQRE